MKGSVIRKLGVMLCVVGVVAAGSLPALAKLATNGESLNGENLNGSSVSGMGSTGGAPAVTGLSLSGAKAVRGRLVR